MISLPILKPGLGFISLIMSIALLSVCFPSGAFADQPVMKTLAAHVVSVAEDGTNISVDFRHPVTKKDQRLIFYMDGQSGLSGIKRLKDLRAGQVVTIDYEEGEKGRAGDLQTKSFPATYEQSSVVR